MKKLDRFQLKEQISDSNPPSFRAIEHLPGDNQREVTLKIFPALTDDQSAEKRFHAEVKILAQLAVHPNIATIYSMGVTSTAPVGTPFIASEFAHATLAQRISDHPAPIDDVRKLLEHVGRALASTHALTPPLLHQALRPSSILIDRSNTFKLTDFSLASGVGDNQTFSAGIVRYSAPELLNPQLGPVTPSSDLYALGLIAYEFALGSRKFREQFPAVYEGSSQKEAQPAKWMAWHCSLNTKPSLLHEVRKDFPLALSELIGRLMSKDTKHRLASADDLLKALSTTSAAVAAPVHTDVIPLDDAPIALASNAPRTTPARTPATSPTIPLSDETPAIPAAAPAQPARTFSRSAPTDSTPSTGTRYFVRLRGNISGPFDVGALQRLHKQGQLSRLHQVSTDRVNWVPASSVEGLFGPPLA